MLEVYKKIKPFLPAFFAILAGISMTYSFAPYYIGGAAILSAGVFLACLKKQTAGKGFLIGWLYGLGMFGSGANWIYVSIHDYGNATPVLAFIITLLFVIALALCPALLGLILCRYFPEQNVVRNLLVFPALWVAFEIIRGWFLTGFPWLYVGYAEMGNHLRSFAPIGGVWLVSWVSVLFASTLYTIINYFYDHQNNPLLRNSLLIGALSIWGIAFGLSQIKWVTPTDKKLDVALIQGNVAQLMRWDPAHLQAIIRTYESLTATAMNSNIIIWPEAAIPLAIPLSTPLFDRLGNVMSEHNIALIAGVPTELSDGAHYYNSLIGIGNAQGDYHKTHLVPFGEYVPFESALRGLIGFFDLPMSSMVSGPLQQNALIAQGYRFAPAICYEIAYPIFVQTMSKEAEFILTVSNDAWFGKSIGPAQHLQIAQFRALENGKYVLRATNTGFTAIIGPQGELNAVSPQFQSNILTGTITVMAGQTPWSTWGPWPVFIGLVIALGAAFGLRLRRKK